MGSWRSSLCCSVSPREDSKHSKAAEIEVKQNRADVIASQEDHLSKAGKSGSSSPQASAAAGVATKDNQSPSKVLESKGADFLPLPKSVVPTPEDSDSHTMAGSSGAAPLSPAMGGGLGSLAARRGFKAAELKGTAATGISISTIQEPKEKPVMIKARRKIGTIDRIENAYSIGKNVMPSSHSGMSIVFAKQKQTGLDVVIKVRMKANSFCDRDEEKEWRSSTEFMLNLPETTGIAKIYEVLEDGSGYYVVMEKVAGQDLFEQVTGQGLLPLNEVKEVMRQLLGALQELHGRNCIHKDLKLENIMFDRTPPANMKADWSMIQGSQEDKSPVQVKLIDFDTVTPASPTRAKDVLGTDQYIAQEAYDGKYSAASDIFAAGVIGYRLLTSKFPFKSDIFNDEAGENWVGSPKMKEIRKKIVNSKIDWSHRVFLADLQCKDLLSIMLASNEKDRPTAQQALSHVWLTSRGRRKSMVELGDISLPNSIAGNDSDLPKLDRQTSS